MNKPEKQKVIVIVGPTASGKTALSIQLAKQYNGEVISADSRQVYIGLTIGTGKVTEEEMQGVRHHLLDVADPRTVFSADAFLHLASEALHDCYTRGVTPIIAGGTGFYIDALLGRTALGKAPADPTLRASLALYTTEELCELLGTLDARRYADIVAKHEVKNRVRLIRAIEIAKGVEKSTHDAPTQQYDALFIGVTHPRDVLKERINTRLRERIAAGMFEEMGHLHERGLSWERMHELGLEYRYGAQFLQGELSIENVEKILQHKIWQYARRQLTYFKRNSDIRWFAPHDESISKYCATFLKNAQ